jgi:hypothetical protein
MSITERFGSCSFISIYKGNIGYFWKNFRRVGRWQGVKWLSGGMVKWWDTDYWLLIAGLQFPVS